MKSFETFIDLSKDSESFLNKSEFKKEIIKELFNRSLNQIQQIKQEYGQNLIKNFSERNTDD